MDEPSPSHSRRRLGLTVTVAVAESQPVGLAVSQMPYRSAYVPIAVPFATLTAPVGRLSVILAVFGVSDLSDSVTLADVARAPPRVSLAGCERDARRARHCRQAANDPL